MEFKTGRLIDHVHLRVSDLEKSKHFYEAVAECLGVDSFKSYDGFFTCDELFVSPANGEVSRVHLAFQTDSRNMVGRFHKVALANGGTDNGGPGERDYHPGYYAAFVLDPDGHNIEAVNHGPVKRSAEAVIQTPAGGA
jgi:catechol 2,3-dioxygenase-like lactoylglutathione lyase family enzyme